MPPLDVRPAALPTRVGHHTKYRCQLRVPLSSVSAVTRSPGIVACIAVVAFFAIFPAAAQTAGAGGSERAAAIDRIAEEALADGPIAGLSLLVAHQGQVVTAKGYGYADLENGVRATAHTVYRLGSLSKQFTATAVLQLVDEARIDLDASIRRYLPDYPEIGEPIAVRNLLNHTSGLVSYTAQSDYWRNIRRDLPHETVLSWFDTRPLAFKPGERYVYSNSGYFLLGMIVERVSGETFPEYLQRNIFDRLKLSETYYDDGVKLIPNRARGYERSDDGFANARWLSMKLAFSTGGLASSVLDLYAFHSALQEGSMVSPEAYRAMTTPAVLNDGTKSEYGMGFHVEQWGNERVLRHGGLIFGFKTCYYYYPDEDLTIIILMNTEQAEYRPIQADIARLFIPDLVIVDKWD